MSLSRPVRIAYLATHPIQYQAPLLRQIAAEPGISLKAFFRSPMGLKQYVDPGFGQTIVWDVPLLEGYEHEFLPAVGDPVKVTPFLRPLNYGLGRRLAEGGFDVLCVHGYARVFHQTAMLSAKARGLKILLRDERTAINLTTIDGDALAVSSELSIPGSFKNLRSCDDPLSRKGRGSLILAPSPLAGEGRGEGTLGVESTIDRP